MKISHDIYSFVQICNFFELKNDIADWSSIRNVKTRDQLSIWINAVEKECGNTNLTCEPFILEQLNKAFGFRQTNSPPRKSADKLYPNKFLESKDTIKILSSGEHKSKKLSPILEHNEDDETALFKEN